MGAWIGLGVRFVEEVNVVPTVTITGDISPISPCSVQSVTSSMVSLGSDCSTVMPPDAKLLDVYRGAWGPRWRDVLRRG